MVFGFVCSVFSWLVIADVCDELATIQSKVCYLSVELTLNNHGGYVVVLCIGLVC